jgi:hypothetical protein
MAAKEGLIGGIKALVQRWRTCRAGYEMILIKSERTCLLILNNKNVLHEHEISEELLRQQRHVLEQ